ncbi:Nucleotide-binding, alpha-beta plait [Cynara cardunculus var. scolymus]|uniref:Nucleotide-binding, alpha-beta plait n=1 Tax=Cynara cardunculus var. scolymus TaxID=59895 RepID=A0A118K4P3_CYNCS|nr:Nucleotide-binding, alpha-beta plait [Cynara cardunculus var. scolymus]
MAATMSGTVNHRVCSSSSPSPSPLLVRSSGITWRSDNFERTRQQCRLSSFLCCSPVNRSSLWPGLSSTLSIASSRQQNCLQVVACVPPSSQPQTTTTFTSSTKLYVSGAYEFRVYTYNESDPVPKPSNAQVWNHCSLAPLSGLSFRTSEESLRNAFQSFGQLIEDIKISTKMSFTDVHSNTILQKMIKNMVIQFLDGRVIFVEFAKPRSQLPQGIKQDAKPYR